LRGLMREQRHWGSFPQLLSATLGDTMTVTLDLPGNGRLHAQGSPTDIAAMTEHCRLQLQQQGILPPYHLLALSLGAMVASDWCYRYPHEVAGAALINTSLRPLSPFYQRLRPRNYLTLLRLALDTGNLLRREQLILQLTSNRRPPAQLLSQWLDYARDAPVSRCNAMRQLCAAIGYRAPLQAPATPLLILCGEADRLVNPLCSHTLAQRWHAPLQSHPDAGHDLPLDEPLWVAQQIQNWQQARKARIHRPAGQ